MAKVKNSVFGIFGQSLELYFTNFGSFFKYMAFPVLGQILGLILTLVASFAYIQNLPKMATPGTIFDNFSMIFLVLFLITIPGLLIFAKAFWDYLVAYGAINSMVDNMLKSGRVYDFPAHTELIRRRMGGFIGLWLLSSLIFIFIIIPIFFFIYAGLFFILSTGVHVLTDNMAFWTLFNLLCLYLAIICAIPIMAFLFVYFVLIFQVFTFEPDKSPIGCFKKSFNIIKGNFLRTVGLMILIGGLTYWLLPYIISFISDFINLTGFIVIPFDAWAQQLPITQVNNSFVQMGFGTLSITSLMVAEAVVSVSLSYIIVCFTLPLRSICWALWYKSLNKGEIKLDKKILDRAGAKD